MERLGIEYDLLPRESEILHLKFWDAAFEHLKQRNAIHLAASGKNAGCWVMRLNDAADAADASGEDDDAKIIVRSNGTVTYVGKDIAYQLWKFGLAGARFPVRKVSYLSGQAHAMVQRFEWRFVKRARVWKSHDGLNVIDARQAYLQNVVVAGLRALGFGEQADRSIHFSYEIVALTPRCARELGYTFSEEEAKKPYVEVSGRKGLGVKADDLLDRLGSCGAEVDQRHPESPAEEPNFIAHAIAIGALRVFLIKIHAYGNHRFRFQGCSQLRGRDRAVLPVRGRACEKYFQKVAGAAAGLRLSKL